MSWEICQRLLVVVAVLGLEVEPGPSAVPAVGEGGGHRDPLPVGRVAEHRGLASRCPGTPDRRRQRGSALILKDDPGLLPAGELKSPATPLAPSARSPPRLARSLARPASARSSPTVAGSSRRARCGTGPRSPSRSRRRPAPASRARCASRTRLAPRARPAPPRSTPWRLAPAVALSARPGVGSLRPPPARRGTRSLPPASIPPARAPPRQGACPWRTAGRPAAAAAPRRRDFVAPSRANPYWNVWSNVGSWPAHSAIADPSNHLSETTQGVDGRVRETPVSRSTNNRAGVWARAVRLRWQPLVDQ